MTMAEEVQGYSCRHLAESLILLNTAMVGFCCLFLTQATMITKACYQPIVNPYFLSSGDTLK